MTAAWYLAARLLLGNATIWVGSCRANMAHTRQSRPDSGLVFTLNAVTTFSVVPSSLGKMGNHVSHGEFGGEFEQLLLRANMVRAIFA
jgi:hypothetical protein